MFDKETQESWKKKTRKDEWLAGYTKGVAIVVAAKQNSLDKPVASTTAPASEILSDGKNPKNPLFTPVLLIPLRFTSERSTAVTVD